MNNQNAEATTSSHGHNATAGGASSQSAYNNQQTTQYPQNNDTRIEIHGTSAPTSIEDPIPIGPGPMHRIEAPQRRLISADDEVQISPSSWRMNLNNVIQLSVRPLVQQQNHAIHSFRTWMPSSANALRYASIRTSQRLNDFQNQAGNSSGASRPNRSRSFNGSSTSNSTDDAEGANESNNRMRNNEFHFQPRSFSNPGGGMPTAGSGGGGVSNENEQIPTNRQHVPNTTDDEENNLAAEFFAKFLKIFLRYLPFLIILALKSTIDHFRGITDLVMLNGAIFHANSSLKEQIARHTQRSVPILIRDLIIMSIIVLARYLFLDTATPHQNGLILFQIYDESLSLSQLFFTVAVTDFLLKIVTIAFKNLITMLPPTVIKYKGRGRIYVVIEAFSQFYRCMAPIKFWLFFLLDSYKGIDRILGVIFSSLYIGLKMFEIVDRYKFLKKSFVNFLQKVNYGKQPTKEEIQTVGEQCPICHDNFDTPVMLECKHIFCELCVGTWFAREQTCPLCRAKVADDPSWQDGSTTYFYQIF